MNIPSWIFHSVRKEKKRGLNKGEMPFEENKAKRMIATGSFYSQNNKLLYLLWRLIRLLFQLLDYIPHHICFRGIRFQF